MRAGATNVIVTDSNLSEKPDMPLIETVQYGLVRYRVFTVADLGVVRNPHMWIGGGFLFCVGCQTYRTHDAYSHWGMSDCFEVCRTCERYYRADVDGMRGRR
jgi:hypothetical protein